MEIRSVRAEAQRRDAHQHGLEPHRRGGEQYRRGRRPVPPAGPFVWTTPSDSAKWCGVIGCAFSAKRVPARCRPVAPLRPSVRPPRRRRAGRRTPEPADRNAASVPGPGSAARRPPPYGRRHGRRRRSCSSVAGPLHRIVSGRLAAPSGVGARRVVQHLRPRRPNADSPSVRTPHRARRAHEVALPGMVLPRPGRPQWGGPWAPTSGAGQWICQRIVGRLARAALARHGAANQPGMRSDGLPAPAGERQGQGRKAGFPSHAARPIPTRRRGPAGNRCAASGEGRAAGPSGRRNRRRAADRWPGWP